MEPVDPARSFSASGERAVVQTVGKGSGLRVIVETVTNPRTRRPRSQAVELVPANEASLDSLAKLLVHHLEPDLKDILK
jgi:hypothetical protein